MVMRSTSEFVAAEGQKALSELAYFDPKLAEMSVGLTLVRAVLDPGYRDSPLPIPSERWADVFHRMQYHRILPQVAAAADTGHLVVPGRGSLDLDLSLVHIAVQSLKLEQVMLRVDSAFSRAGIPFLVLKGMATSQLDFVRPELRTAVDVDLLISEHDLARAGVALNEVGFEYPYEIESLMDKGQTWVDTAGWHVDLHTRLHAPGRPLDDRWWSLAEPFEVGGRTFRALPRSGRLAHAASHLALSWPSARRLSSLLDLIVLSAAVDPVEREAAETLLSEMHVSDVVHRVTSRAATMLDMPTIVLGEASSRPFDLLLRRAYDRSDDEKFSMKFSTFAGMPRKEQCLVVQNWVNPSSKYLERGGYTSRWDRVRAVAWRAWPARRSSGVARWFVRTNWSERFTVVCAVVLTPLVQLGLRTRGYAPTKRLLQRFRRMPVAPMPHRRTAQLAESTMKRLPVPVTCLERSLVVWWVLGGDGVAQIRLGAAPPEGGQPPAFHAWVEVQGRVVNDRPDVADIYWPFPEPRGMTTGRFRS